MQQQQQHLERGPNDHILVSPIWVFVCRIFQALLSLIILALAARLMHDAYLDEEGLALAIAIITWVVVAYARFSERFQALHHTYNIIAVLVLDGVMMILWLATFAAVAARRAKFVFNVSVEGCVDDGSLINSKTCLTKRSDVILFKSGGDMLAAIAGLGALVWLLFIATFSWTLYGFLKGRKEGRFLFGNETVTTHTFVMESKQDQQQQQQQQPNQPQYPTQDSYPQQPSYSPPPQQATYTHYPPQQQQQYQQPIQSPYQAQ